MRAKRMLPLLVLVITISFQNEIQPHFASRGNETEITSKKIGRRWHSQRGEVGTSHRKEERGGRQRLENGERHCQYRTFKPVWCSAENHPEWNDGTALDIFCRGWPNRCFEAKRVLAADPNQPDLLFAFHGTRIDALPKVITGLVAKRTTDPGYFGAGVYVTPNLEYAAQYAVGKFDSPSATGGPRSSREDGSYPVVLVCAAIGEAHPITRSGDYRKGPEHGSLLQAANTNSDWYGKPLKPGCDAHVVGVSERTNFQAEDDLAHMTYLEIVIDQEAQVLPLAIIWVQPTPP